jgi:serine/threonine protein kinase
VDDEANPSVGPAAQDFTIGTYRLVAELGHGGMGDVFLALSTPSNGAPPTKFVVIKRLREHLAKDSDFIGMLLDEARIAVRLNHPNVVRTLEIGETASGYFLAMEYLDGQSVRRIMNRKRMPLDMHCSVLKRTLAGLHHAHELAEQDGTPLHVVHRDVTPDNVFVTYDGQVKVIDFGIAKAVGRGSETRHGMVKGKAAYLAPEQVTGGAVDRRADLFAVGILLWQGATGKRIWHEAKNQGEIFQSLARGRIPASPRAVDPEIPERVDAICRRALAFRPEDRYATALEFETDLSAYLEERGGPSSDRDLGAWVSDLFADRREQARVIIEKQLSALHTHEPSAQPLLPVPAESITGRTSTVPVSSSSRNVTGASNTQPQSYNLARDARPTEEETATLVVPSLFAEPRSEPSGERRHAPLYALVGSLALGLIGVGFLVAALARVGRSTVASTAPPPVDSATVPAPSARRTILLSLQATPPETRVTIDDGPPEATPLARQVPRDLQVHRIRAAAPGYRAVAQTGVFADDISFRFSLAREGTKPGSH